MVLQIWNWFQPLWVHITQNKLYKWCVNTNSVNLMQFIYFSSHSQRSMKSREQQK